ncbi:hypothetical protein [Streptomyces radicis]|uniref:hypothetical protein n=1 Tax=Streptomyces radicis TaxID=1750517 RepID=UPI001C7CCFE9|nr:hypothetical protein [Streptomyces radicis]
MTTAREDELIVAETFGPTFQGEGPSAGQQAVFIRLSRCDLSCGTHPSASGARGGNAQVTALTPMDAANVRRASRRALARVDGIDPADWTPREGRPPHQHTHTTEAASLAGDGL